MPDVRSSILELIGSTPLLELGRHAAARQLKARLIAKVEYFNSPGSVRDRAALAIIRAAERSEQLTPGGLNPYLVEIDGVHTVTEVETGRMGPVDEEET